MRFIKCRYISTLRLDEDLLSNYCVNYLMEVTTFLRTKGLRTKDKIEAADEIKAYCTRKNIISYFRKMQKVSVSQPEDFYEDPVEEEIQFNLARAEQRRKLGEPVLPEEPIRDEPPTPVHRSQEVEEGEVVHSNS